MISIPSRLSVVAGLAVLLTGCGGPAATASDRRAPVVESSGTGRGGPVVSEQSVSLREPDSPVRTVVHGDTLYSIAWETGRDYRELAKWNHIPPPYTIKPGQALRVKPPPRAPADRVTVRPSATGSKVPATKPAQDHGAPSKVNGTAAAKRAQPAASEAVRKAGPTPPTLKPKPVSGAEVADKRATSKKGQPVGTTAKASPTSHGGRAGTHNWIWPADGQVLNRYSESESRGVDIAAARGAAVRAAESGRVVYQGSGLRGYGQLIIIKHSDDFLSAYAHNDRIYVKEGDAVKRGQKIADMGSTGTDRVKLHFEIRRQGVPVDPLKYLPRR